MDKSIQQHTTDGRYLCVNCNDQGSSVLINAISENGLISVLYFILQLAEILERLCWMAGSSFTIFCDNVLSNAI